MLVGYGFIIDAQKELHKIKTKLEQREINIIKKLIKMSN